jgi:ribosomal protein S27AE
MKNCFKCGERKPLTEFYKHPQMADGRLNKCKECNKLDVKNNKALRADYYRDYEKQRANLPHRVAARRAYALTDAGKKSGAKAKKKWLENNTVKRAAHIILGNAVRDGKIVKLDVCEECGEGGKIHGHHDDYSQPLYVRWLCPKCHADWHKRNEPRGC